MHPKEKIPMNGSPDNAPRDVVRADLTSQSHVDHLPDDVRDHVLAVVRAGNARLKVGAWDGFYICEVELPSSFAPVQCALVGPATGLARGVRDTDADTFFAKRGNRPNLSKLTRLPPSLSRLVTVIVLPGGKVATLYGGPLAPKERTDPFLKPEEVEASHDFWAEHALSAQCFDFVL